MLKLLINVINRINYIVGLLLGLTILLIAALVVYEVTCRYFFNAPTLWSMEINEYLFCAVSLMGGGYCLLKDGHVRVDLLYPRLSAKGQAVVDFCTFPLALLFCVLLVWHGWQETWGAFVGHHLSDSVMAMPLWPAWLTVPLAGFLMGIQIISRLLGHIDNLMSTDAAEQG
ncbi:TRAP transporter small permease subunit [Desulfatitalea tepidiphila]|uniref:TRAP transporter small permease subunit n=1 Tax=Desulfatitalea tepidiphila TaxID=1185843 RepID=UPI0006B49239|nr:TRAP transporter small permease subunit [Desulfatitalea tepidiphila]